MQLSSNIFCVYFMMYIHVDDTIFLLYTVVQTILLHYNKNAVSFQNFKINIGSSKMRAIILFPN